MKITPFTKYHIAAGAKMAPFAGFNMPIEFTGINAEHLWVREAVGVFDVSHMGQLILSGEAYLLMFMEDVADLKGFQDLLDPPPGTDVEVIRLLGHVQWIADM